MYTKYYKTYFIYKKVTTAKSRGEIFFFINTDQFQKSSLNMIMHHLQVIGHCQRDHNPIKADCTQRAIKISISHARVHCPEPVKQQTRIHLETKQCTGFHKCQVQCQPAIQASPTVIQLGAWVPFFWARQLQKWIQMVSWSILKPLQRGGKQWPSVRY